MKIAILTLFYNNFNYGAHLQALALSKVFQTLNMPCEVIQFDWNAFYSVPKNGKKKILFKRILPFIVRKVFGKLMKKNFSRRRSAFTFFDDRCIKTFSDVLTVKDLSRLNELYDGFVVGSDQVWRFINRDPNANAAFLLNFTEKKKMAYAASLGLKHIPVDSIKFFEKYLPSFDFISVRERLSKHLLSQYVEQNIDVTLDPTLLLTTQEWSSYKAPIVHKKKKYILCYFISESETFRKAAELISNEWNIGLCSIPYMSMGFNKADFLLKSEKLYDVSPSQFLTLISEAELVLTDSFHALVFSLLFKKKFQVFLRKEGAQGGMSERITDLLSNAGLSNLLIEDEYSERIQKDTELDFDKFEDYIAKNRERSIDFILQMGR